MKRARRPSLILSFSTTASALQAEQHLTAQGCPGRLIPLPAEIRADCGLAWLAEPQQREALCAELERAGIAYDGCTVLDF